MIFKKHWITFERAVKKYHPYTTVDFDIIWVNPNDIIALTFPAKQIKNDEKMGRLRRAVDTEGWDDKCPADLHLYLLPNGKYTVSTGGNHRAYLANELKISLIQSYITILIPEKWIKEEQRENLNYYRELEERYELKAREIKKLVKRRGSLQKGFCSRREAIPKVLPFGG